MCYFNKFAILILVIVMVGFVACRDDSPTAPGEKDLAKEEEITVDPPTLTSVSRNLTAYVKVVWEGIADASSYRVYRARQNNDSSWGSYSLVATVSNTVYYDQKAEAARFYSYKVTAVKSDQESTSSNSKTGYRMGWRFADVRIYNPSNGIGFCYDLYGYGYLGKWVANSIYAIYYKDGSYFFVPGEGFKDMAATILPIYPTIETLMYNDLKFVLYTTTWHEDWRNNTYPQYIQMRVHSTIALSSLNDAVVAQTGIYKIIWTQTSAGEMQMEIGPMVSEEEAETIMESLMDTANPVEQ